MAAFIVRPDRNCLQNAVRCMAAKPAVQNHKGIPSALQICDPCSRSALAGWQASGAGASGILLSDIFESGERKWLSVCSLSADFLRCLRLSKRPGSEGCSRYHQRIFAGKRDDGLYRYFDRKTYQISGKLFDDIAVYIDDRYVEEHTDRRAEQSRCSEAWQEESCFEAASIPLPPEAICKSCSSQSLEEALGQMDESFSEMLLRKIEESGMTDAQCYKKANIDRKLFSKIRSDRFYKPSKPTVLAFALALELPLAQMQEMLGKAGFTLSHSSKFDIIVEYFVERGNYNVYEINEALFAFDQSLIGT